jgi:hypothetical protein
MGHGGGEGRVSSLMNSAVEREVTKSYVVSFVLMRRPWAIRLKRECNEIRINLKGISPWSKVIPAASCPWLIKNLVADYVSNTGCNTNIIEVLVSCLRGLSFRIS